MKLIVAIIGPTASGKTTFAISLAQSIGGEILCVDSTTVYRGFDIGTSKPTKEERNAVPHHLVDILDPNAPFSAGDFVRLANQAIADCESRGKVPILVGGTYFYLRALQNGMNDVPEISSEVLDAIEKEFLEGESLNTVRMHAVLAQIDPKSAQSIHPNDRYRLLRALGVFRATGKPPSELRPVLSAEDGGDRYWLKYAIGLSRQTLHQAIQNRVEAMLSAGLVEETRKLIAEWPEARPLQSIGYAESVAFLKRQLTEKQLRTEIIEKTRQLAKRQITWLRSDPEIRYIDFRDIDRVKLEITNLRYLFERKEPCAQ